MNKLLLSAVATFSLLSSTTAFTQSATKEPLVLVSMAPVYELTEPLLAGTNVKLQLLPEEPRSMQSQTTLFTRQAERFTEQFNNADAVITIGKVWSADPLYTAAREANIRIINIDASKPWSHELDGVAVANSPSTKGMSPYFWLSPANVIRMVDIIGSDLERLYPDQAATIAGNLQRVKGDYVKLKLDAEQRFATVGDPVVYALTDEFIYLTSDLGVFVDDYFVKQDIDWKPEDYSALTQRLRDGGIRVVLHKWDPSAQIKQAITDGGAQLVVLDNLETTTDFHAGLDTDIRSLIEALDE